MNLQAEWNKNAQHMWTNESKPKYMGLKIVIIFLSIGLNICFGCSKDCLAETVLLSTHNICFG